MHTFDADFYGSLLKSSIVGFIRTERNFSSLGTVLTCFHVFNITISLIDFNLIFLLNYTFTIEFFADELKEAIANDIAIAKEKLSLPENQAHTQLFSAN